MEEDVREIGALPLVGTIPGGNEGLFIKEFHEHEED